GYVEAVASERVQSQINTGEPIDLEDLVEGVDETRIAEIVRLSREHDVYVVPTQYLWQNIYATAYPEPFLQQPEMRYVSEVQKNACRQQGGGGTQGTPEARRAFFDLRYRI